MNVLCFTVEIDKNRFPDVLDFIKTLDDNDILYMSNEYDLYDNKNNSLCYRFEFDNDSVNRVGEILAKLIKSDFLRKYADDIIDTNYLGIEGSDRQNVVSDVLKCADICRLSLLLREFICENKHIHLGGFVLFRMKEYLTEFEDEIDFAIDEFIREKRYRDFVRFLKFFIDIQESVFENINLVLKNNGQYKLLDENGLPISKDLLDSTYCEISSLEDEGYVMLNDLVSLAPVHLTIHCKCNEENNENIKIIKEIFSDRVDFCHNCSMCLSMR